MGVPNIFKEVPVKRPKRNVFDLSHSVLMTSKMGNLMPCLCEEMVPNDTFTVGAKTFMRLAPMIRPIMHRVDISIHYWFVPNRILWEGWEPFIVDDPDDPRVAPYITLSNESHPMAKQLADYLGICPPPDGTSFSENVSALPFAAYQKIYNDWYRPQQFVQDLDDLIQLVDGDNTGNSELINIRRRSWEHDYFTSALPSPQSGIEIDIPLGDIRLKEDWSVGSPNPFWIDNNGDHLGDALNVQTAEDPANNFFIRVDGGGNPIAYDPNGSLETSPTTINDFRRAIALQTWAERSERGGKRYAEMIRSHFGVRPQDARLQRAEYVTGIKAPVVISEVLNSTGMLEIDAVETGVPQGDMAGHGVATTGGKFGSYFAQEHGWMIGILSVMPKTAYQDGIHRKFTRTDFLDYFWPDFAHLGEQEVKNREVCAYRTGADGTFGYNPRYSEYKFAGNRVAGEFRTTMDDWHLGRKFNPASPPTLSAPFIECDPEDTERIFAVQDGTDPLWIHVIHGIKAVRPMPVFGVPMI